ncbi:MAG: DUF3604 domain-containing protein [Pseudomonadota bacterium]
MNHSKKLFRWGAISATSLILIACDSTGNNTANAQDNNAQAEAPAAPASEEKEVFWSADNRIPNTQAPVYKTKIDTIRLDADQASKRQALFGDLHIHTRYSFDAFAFGTIATPADGYRYAKGEAIKHPAGFDMQIKAPLDFYGITDHAMFLGAVAEAANTDTEFSKLELAQPLHNLNRPENLNTDSAADRGQRFSTFIPSTLQALQDGKLSTELLNNIARSAWRDSVKAAEEHNEPGKFTTFIAYEYTSSTDERGNLHRNVVFRGGDSVPDIPFSRFHSQNPEGLWRWMDDLREMGIDSIAIPHNSNGSNGSMFMETNWLGQPIDVEYAELRMRNEPLVEMTQVKGTSETHPALSPNDEWADFEIMPYRIATVFPSEPVGSYVRHAYGRGLELAEKNGGNPYKFGMIGSSDTHTGAGSYDEDNFFAKIGILDATANARGSVPLSETHATTLREANPDGVKKVIGKDYREGALQTWGASGLAAVWAEENTRDDIFDAFRRKETFATSGPRIRVRLFAGFDFADDLTSQVDWVKQAYASGVSMGADLPAEGNTAPKFAVWATRDAMSAPLQRIQIVKGWLEGGKAKEQVYDVACSDGLAVDAATHRCPDNGAKIDIADCKIPEDTGAAELSTVWTDPNHKPDQSAFYYVRVLENPTCRWSTWDALKAGVEPRPDLHKTIQERAWSSPIWYVPEGQ